MKPRINAKKIGNNIVQMRKIILKMTNEANSVRRLLILENSVISPKNVLRVSYAEVLKQPIRKPQSYVIVLIARILQNVIIHKVTSLVRRLSNHWVILLNMKYYVQEIEWQVPLPNQKNCLLK